MTRRLVIAGGGITGLAAAHAAEAAARQGGLDVEIVLVEASPRLGGKVASETVAGMVIEQGPDSFLARKPWARDLCRAVGLERDLVGGPAVRGTYVALGRRLVPLPEGTMMVAPIRWGPLLRTPLLSPLGKARALLDLVLPPRPAAGDESLGALVRRRLGNEVAERIAAPLFSGIYGCHVDRLSLLTTFPQLRELEERYGSLIRGFRAAGAAGLGGGEAGGGGPGPQFLTLRYGLESLVTAVAAALRDTRIVTGCAVRGAERLPGGGYRLRLADGSALETAAVIWTIPAHAAAQVLAAAAPDLAGLLAAVPYVSTAVVAMAFAPEQVEHPLDASGFVVPYGQGRALTACTWVSRKWPHASPRHVLLRAFVGRDGEQDALGLSDGELARAVLADLRELMGVRGEPVLTRIYRWPEAMPRYAVGHLDRVAAMEAALRDLPGHFMAGAAFRGVGIPDCIRQGQEAAARALQYLTGTR